MNKILLGTICGIIFGTTRLLNRDFSQRNLLYGDSDHVQTTHFGCEHVNLKRKAQAECKFGVKLVESLQLC